MRAVGTYVQTWTFVNVTYLNAQNEAELTAGIYLEGMCGPDRASSASFTALRPVTIPPLADFLPFDITYEANASFTNAQSKERFLITYAVSLLPIAVHTCIEGPTNMRRGVAISWTEKAFGVHVAFVCDQGGSFPAQTMPAVYLPCCSALTQHAACFPAVWHHYKC